MTNAAAGAVSLKVLAERKIEGVGKATNFNVDPRLIKIQPGFNARPIDPEHVASLKLSYMSGTPLPPLYVRVSDGEIIVVGGHHRLTAMMELITEGNDIKSIPCIEFKGTDAERIVHMLTSAQSKPVTPLQAGVQYRLLLNMGWTSQQIANACGKSITHVSQAIELASSNSDVQTMVNNNEVAAHVALATVKKHGEKAGPVLAEALVKAKANGKSKVTAKTVKASPFDALMHQPTVATPKPPVPLAEVSTEIYDNAVRFVFVRDKMTPDQIVQWAMGGKKTAIIDNLMKVAK